MYTWDRTSGVAINLRGPSGCLDELPLDGCKLMANCRNLLRPSSSPAASVRHLPVGGAGSQVSPRFHCSAGIDIALLGKAHWEVTPRDRVFGMYNLEGDHLSQTYSTEQETLNLAHGDWQIKRWDSQRRQRRGEIGSPGTAVPQREFQGRPGSGDRANGRRPWPSIMFR